MTNREKEVYDFVSASGRKSYAEILDYFFDDRSNEILRLLESKKLSQTIFYGVHFYFHPGAY